MTNRFYNNSLVAVPLTTIRSQVAIQQFESVEQGLDEVETEMDLKAPAANPVFTGVVDATGATSVLVPDLAITDSTNKAATTEFVQQVVGASESLLPLQTGFTNKVLKTNGTFAYWAGAFETDEALFHRVLLQDNTGFFNIGHPVIGYSTLAATCKEFVITGSLVCLIPSGATSVVYTSADGINWVSRALPASMTANTVTVLPGTQRILITPNSGTAAALSTDGGVTWAAATLPAGFASRISASTAGFVGSDGAVGTYYTSATGATGSWTSRATPMPVEVTDAPFMVGSGSNILIASTTGASTVYSTDTGATWTVGAAMPWQPRGRIAIGAGKFAAGYDNAFAYSATGASWATATPSANITVFNLCYGDKFVAVGSNASSQPVASRSTDGITWTTVTIEAATYTAIDVAWNGTFYLAVGGNGTVERMWTSPDAITWTPVAAPPNGGSGSLDFVAWDAAGSRWVCVRDNAANHYAWYSANGATWTLANASIGGTNGLAYINGAVYRTPGNPPMKSTDGGVTWTDVTIPGGGTVDNLYWTGSGYLLHDSGNHIVYSQDLAAWKEIPAKMDSLYGCAGGIAANYDIYSASFWRSVNGLTWSFATAPLPVDINDLGVNRATGDFAFISGSTKYSTADFSTWTSAAVQLGATGYPAFSVNGVLFSGSAGITGLATRAYVSDNAGVSWREYSAGFSGGFGSNVLKNEMVVFGTKVLAKVGTNITTFDQTMKGPMYS